MAVLITEIIPTQGFEIVEYTLGAILLEEITNQVTLQSLDEKVEVYVERMTPYDKSEDVLINVQLSNIDLGGQTQSGQQGNCTFLIDVYVRGEETEMSSGSDVSLLKRNKYLGMIRYILASTKYKTLGFSGGAVTSVRVTSIQNEVNAGRMDAAFIKYGQLSVTVLVNEIQAMWEGIPLFGNDTTVKIENTEKGFKLIFNN